MNKITGDIPTYEGFMEKCKTKNESVTVRWHKMSLPDSILEKQVEKLKDINESKLPFGFHEMESIPKAVTRDCKDKWISSETPPDNDRSVFVRLDVGNTPYYMICRYNNGRWIPLFRADQVNPIEWKDIY